MARRPAHTLPAGALSSRDVIWAAIRAQDGEFSVLDVEGTAHRIGGRRRIALATIKTYLQSLAAAGYLEWRQCRDTESGRWSRARWRLVRDVGVEAPRVTRDGRAVQQGAGRQQMWRAIRILAEFTATELAIAASTPEHIVAQGEARAYLGILAQAGYLVVTRRGVPALPTRYRLVQARWSGPRAPMVQRVKALWDPNLGAIVWSGRGGEAHG